MPTRLTIAELKAARDADLGASDWLTLGQARIDLFADATGDHQWIHVDPDRAGSGPYGRTIAHGYLLLSLVPRLLGELLEIADAGLSLNYGADKVRFTAPVPSGAEVRLKARLVSAEERLGGALYRVAAEIEVRGAPKPALVAELLYLTFPS